MASWVNCVASDSGFGGWAADLGEWAGAWPMQYPLSSGSNDGDELDFAIGLDNPAHPGDPLFMLDGTYASPVWDAWRITGTPDTTDWATFAVGGGTTPTIGETPPAGAHIWVVAYFADPISGDLVEPPNAPETYLPASYSAAGTGPEPSGGWSDWFDGFDVLRGATPETGSFVNIAHHAESAEQPDSDLSGLAGASAAYSVTNGTVSGSAAIGDATGGLFQVGAEHDPVDPILAPLGFSTASVDVNQFSADFAADTTPPAPDLAGLTPGTDYADAPFYGTPTAFETDTPAGFQWGAFTYQMGGVMTPPWVAFPFDDPHTIIGIAWTTAPPLDGDPMHSFGDLGLHHLHDDLIYWFDETDPLGAVRLFDLGGNADPPPQTFTMLVGWTLADPGSSLTNDPYPNGPTPVQYDWGVVFGWGDGDTVALPFSFTTGRWRYWRLHADVKWHTIGGHWATPTGVTLKRLTPGAGWVDVVDGPA